MDGPLNSLTAPLSIRGTPLPIRGPPPVRHSHFCPFLERTRPASDHFVVLTSSSESADTDILTSPQTIDSATAHKIYVSNWDVTNDARMDDPIMCRNLVDHVSPLEYWSSLCNLYDAEFLNRLNLNFALHVCVVSELQRCGDCLFKIKVGEGESEAMKVDVFHGQGEIKLKEQFMAMQDAEIQRLADRDSALDTCLSELNYKVDSELYLYMLTTVTGCRWVIGHGLRLAFMKCCQSLGYQTNLVKVITVAIDQGIQQGLEVGVEHGKAVRGLSAVAAYDPRDAPLKRLMASLYLEGSFNVEDKTPNFRRLQPALEASRAHAQMYKRDVSSSLIVSDSVASGSHNSFVVPIVKQQRTSSSLIATAVHLNSLAITDYLISDVRLVKTVTGSELQNLTYAEDHQLSEHDDMYDSTILDKHIAP
nr:hypothetical protein [Tanacetum cinerariifolium]